MTQNRSWMRKSVAIALAALFSGATVIGVMPVNGQEMDEQEPLITGPQPLIQVMPGPRVPALEPPPDEHAPLPARYSEPVGQFTMYMDVIASGPSEYGLFTAPGCVLDGIFKRGMKLVWRFEVYDMSTRMRITDRDGAAVSVTLPDGTVQSARFEVRGGGPGQAPPPDAPWTWVAVWNIPPDYPLGPVDYAVNVRLADGRTDSLHPSSWGSRYPMIVD